MDTSPLEAAGLYDPSSPDAGERLSLLLHLLSEGVSIEEMVQADNEGQLVTVGGDRMLFGGERHSAREVAERIGASPDLVRRIWVAAGLPAPAGVDDPVFGPASLDAFNSFTIGATVFGEEPMVHFTRVLGQCTATIAEAAVSLFLTEVESPLRAAGGTESELALAEERAVGSLAVVPQAFAQLLPEHLALAVRRSRLARTSTEGFVRAVLAIGFVDLVGYTELSERVSGTDLAEALSDFESAAWELVGSHGGRVVKFIGDEVMFVSPDPSAACAIALRLCWFAGTHPLLTGARGSVGHGEVFVRDGDYFGSTVNLTSRLVKAPDPGGVVTPGPVAWDPADGLRLVPMGRRSVRGVAEPVELLAVERSEP